MKLSAGNHVQNLLGKGDDDTACQGEEAIGTLGRIMGLQGQTNLDNAPTQQDQTHGPNHAEDEVRQIINNGERITAGGRCRHCKAHNQSHGQHGGTVEAEPPLDLMGHGQLLGGMIVLLKDVLHWCYLQIIIPLQSLHQKEAQIQFRIDLQISFPWWKRWTEKGLPQRG